MIFNLFDTDCVVKDACTQYINPKMVPILLDAPEGVG
jgi:hypothetical protein